MVKLLLILFLLFPVSAWATVYHCATDGSGDYTTIAQLDAATTSGDIVYLRRGDIWAENLLTDSGVIYNAYGTGNLPQVNRLTMWDKNNVSISNLKFVSTVAGNHIIQRSQNITISYCEVDGDNISGHCFATLGSAASWCDNILFDHLTVYDAGNVGISFQNYTSNSTIQYCDVSNSGTEPNIQFYSSVEAGANYNITVKGNTCYNAQTHGINIGFYSYNSIVDGNYCYNNILSGITTDKWAHDNIIKNNICLNNGENFTCGGNSETKNNKFLHNTVINNDGTYCRGIIFNTGIGTGNTYYNNIIFGDSQWFPLITLGDSIIVVLGDYNCLYSSDVSPRFEVGANVYNSLSSWQSATGQDLHSLSTDPLLTSDYGLTKTSPCIDAGTDVDVETDYWGVYRPMGSGFDIGSFEYGNVIKNAVIYNSTLN